MPLTLQKNCKVCKLIEAGDTKLLKRLYQSSYYRGDAGEPQTKILAAYKDQFKKNTLWKHLKNHQALSQEDLEAAVIKRAADRQTKALVKEAITADSARTLVIQKGYNAVKSGKAKVTTKDLLQATKQDADIKAKQTDQALLMQEMAFKFMSGEFIYGLPDGDNPAERPNVLDVSA